MEILGFGYPCMDFNILCPSMPAEEELVPLIDCSLMGGGKVANAVLAAARLGAETAFIGAVGTDRYGVMCREDLKRHGVHVGHLQAREGNTAFCVSIVDEKTHGKHYIESEATFAKIRPEELNREYIGKAHFLMLYQMDETAVQAARIVKEAGGKVIVDADGMDERVGQNLELIDILIASEYYYLANFPDHRYELRLKQKYENGPEITVVTLGGKGCVGLENGTFFRTEAYPVPVKDTTGAGDVFHGAFAAALARGLSALEAADIASAAAAIKCTILGGRTGMPTWEGIEHFLRTGSISPEDFAQREQFYRNQMWDC